VLYSVYSCGLSVLLRFRNEVSAQFSLGVHAAERSLAGCHQPVYRRTEQPVFSLLHLCLLAAAFRWGMREALLTAANGNWDTHDRSHRIDLRSGG